MAKGKEEGISEVKIKTARAMLAEGMSVATVYKCTDLPADEVEALIK
jgi:predicted transposase/invertase (TIGR01784 family)